MICPKCNNRLATIRYAEVVDGVVTERYLCPDCLARMQQDSTAGFELSSAIPAAARPSSADVAEDAVRTQRACPGCGILLSQVLETGKVGCARCYETFATEIDDRLEALHHALHHKGKALRVDDAKSRLMADLQNKRGLLRTVLRAEKYEDAARLRDEIKTLESALYSAGMGRE
jgi:protein arginine kinase activator